MDVRDLGLTNDDLEALGYTLKGKQQGSSESFESPGAPGRPARTAPRDGAAGTWFWTAAILLGLAWSASTHRLLPNPVPANRPDSVFSSGRAMSQLVEIARAPRPLGSPEHARVTTLVADRIRALGLEAELQTALVPSVHEGTTRIARVQNVLARIPGSAPAGAVALTAHLDSHPLSAGAGDDGMGVAAVLETIRAIRAGAPLDHDVIVVLTDGKELGSLGAHAFVNEHPWMSGVRAVVAVDVDGVSGPAMVVPSPSENGRLVSHVTDGLARPVATPLMTEMDDGLVAGTDLATFLAAGIPGFLVTSRGGREMHRQVSDRAGEVSERTLQHQGETLLALTRRLGRADLDAVGSGGPAEAYLTLPVLGVLAYPRSWSLFGALGLGALWVLTALVFRAKGGRPRRAAAGLTVAIAITALSAGAGWLLVELLRTRHPEFGFLDSSSFADGVHLLGLTLGVCAISLAIHAIARSRLDEAELLAGATLLPVGIAGSIAVATPSAAGPALIPLLFGLLATAIVLVLNQRQRKSRWAWTGFLVLGCGVLWPSVPAHEALGTTSTLGAAPILAALMGGTSILLFPIFESLLRPKPWLAPALAGAAGLGLIVIALPQVPGGPDHPLHTSLIHLAEDSLSMPLASLPNAGDSADVTTAEPVEPRWTPGRWLTIPSPGDEWVRQRVVGTAGGGTEPGRLFLPSDAAWTVAGGASDAQLIPIGITVVEAVVTEQERRLRLRLTPGLGGEMVGLHLPEDAPGELITFAGLDLTTASDDPLSRRSVSYWGWTESEALQLEMVLPPGVPGAVFDVVEHHLRPVEVLQDDFFARGEGFVPDPRTGSDRVIRRTRVTLSIP